MNWALGLIVAQLIFLEGILSIDNAAVLGAMVAHLPDHLPIVWPDPLRAFGNSSFNEVFDWALAPLARLARLAWRGWRALLPLAGPAAQSARRADEMEHGKE